MTKYLEVQVWCQSFFIYTYIYTALQKFGNALENGVLDNIGMNPF